MRRRKPGKELQRLIDTNPDPELRALQNKRNIKNERLRHPWRARDKRKGKGENAAS